MRAPIPKLIIAAMLLFAAAWIPNAQAKATAINTRFDGSWNLVFVTVRGAACDPTYNFTVDVRDGIISHPNLLKFRGRVAPSGAVWASVSVGQKFASGNGRLSKVSGRGKWSGRGEGGATCGGYWTAQRD